MTKKDTLLFSLILAAIPAGLYLVMWDPLFTGQGYEFYTPATAATAINTYRGEYTGYDTTFQESNTLVEKYKKMADAYKSVDRTIFDTLTKSIPDDIDKLTFVNEVSSMIEKNGIAAGNVTLTAAPDLNGIKAMSFNFTVKGSYESIKDIVYAFEQSSRFMSVRSFTITPPGPEEIGNPYTFVASIDAYKLK